MRKYLLTFSLIAMMSINGLAQSHVWMLGPMIHFNFGNKTMHTSFGLELAYWNLDHFPYSFDGAIEFEKKKVRLYSEAQTGIGFLGVSLGPVMEFRSDESNVKLGIQGSGWLNYFGGADIRFRSIGGDSFFSPGLYFKLPMVKGGDSHSGSHHWHWDD